MKNTSIILLTCLFAISGFAGQSVPFSFWKNQNASSSINYLGTVFSDNFNRSIIGANWTTNGNPSAVVTGNQLQVTTSTPWVNYLYWNSNNFYTLSETWAIDADISMASSGFGAAFGLVSTNGYNSWYAWLNMNASPAAAAILYGPATAPAAAVTGSSTLSFSPSDVIHIHVGRTNDWIFINATNTANNQTATAAYEMNRDSGHIAPGPANVFIDAVGGTTTIDNFVFAEHIQIPVNHFIIGYSITAGYSADGSVTIANRWANSLGLPTVVSAVPGAKIADHGLVLHPEDLLYGNKKVLMEIGGNDTFNAALTNAYTNIVMTLQAAGATVVHLLPTPRNTADPATLRAWIQSTYPTTCIDTYTPLVSGGGLNAAYDSGDGVHPNAAGHAKMATAITSSSLWP